MTIPSKLTAPRNAASTRIAATISFPSITHLAPESSLNAFFRHSWLQCRRLLFMWLRDSSTTAQALVYPALTLLMFRIVLGDQITEATGVSSVYGTTTMITLVAAMSGSMVSALGLRAEAEAGLVGRLASMPMNRAAGLAGRIMAESIRIFVTSALILVVGVCLGMRFHEGPVAVIALLGIPILFGMAFATLVTTLATSSSALPLVDVVSIVLTIMMFFNTGFVPVMAYPTWLQDVVANQPMSCAIDAMKGLSLGGPVAEPLLKTLAWSVGIIAAFAVPAVRGHRRAALMGP